MGGSGRGGVSGASAIFAVSPTKGSLCGAVRCCAVLLSGDVAWWGFAGGRVAGARVLN
jgi:hypothetical protein